MIQGDDIPKKNWTKQQYLDWLKPKMELENRKYTNAELYEICQSFIDTSQVYNSEKIMSKYGVKCLRLPPYRE